MRNRIVVGLGTVVAAVFLAFGFAEFVRIVGSGDGGWWFWLPTLIGGGVIMLIGLFRMPNHPGASVMVMGLGAALGSLATLWTIVLPLLAFTAVVLRAARLSAETPPVHE